MNDYWNRDQGFKEVIRREVLEYIVKGFEKIYVETDPKIKTDNFLIQQFQNNYQFYKQERHEDERSFIEKYLCCCFQKPDEFHENYEVDLRKSLVFGHPDLIKKVPIMSKTQIENEAEAESPHVIP